MRQYSNDWYGAAIGFITSFWTGVIDLVTDDRLLKFVSLIAGLYGIYAAYYAAKKNRREYLNLKKENVS